MHGLNISGLATYVNCPEIYQANDHFSASFPRGRVPPDRHVHERGARRGPDAPVSSRSQERCRRRLSRDPSARSVPLAGGPRLARKPCLDRGAEPPHRRLPRGDPGAARDPRAATKLWNYPKYGTPFRKGRRYFFSRTMVSRTSRSCTSRRRSRRTRKRLLDPNLLSEDGTVALSTLAVSDDGRLLAYGTSASGSDWEEFRVRTSRRGKTGPTISSGSSSPEPRGARTAPVSSIAGIRSPRTRPSPT